MEFNVWATIKRFLVGFSYKELLVFFFFLAVSAVFWAFTALNEVVERDLRVPVTLVNVPSEVIVTTNVTDTISVTIVDKGFSFLNYERGSGVSPIQIDFMKYAKQSGYGSVSAADLQRLVLGKLNSSSKLTEIKPNKLEFYYNYGQSKKVPVKVMGNITPAANYYVDKITVQPSEVTVYAQQYMLDTLNAVYTVDLNEFNFVTDIERSVQLKTQPGVKVVPDAVKVTIHPDILMDKTIEVPIVPENVPEGVIMRTFPSRVTVNYTAGTNVIGKINENSFLVTVDYRDVAGGAIAVCPVYLRKKIDGVNNASLAVDQVDFLIETINEE